MPTFANERDKLTAPVIVNWIDIAREEVEDIGIWREKCRDVPYDYRFTPPPVEFLGLTMVVVNWIAANHPNWNPEPLLTVNEAVKAWYRDRDADDVPEQRRLEADLDRAIILANACHAAIVDKCETNEGPAAHESEDSATRAPLVTELTAEQRAALKVIDDAGPIKASKVVERLKPPERFSRDDRDKLNDRLRSWCRKPCEKYPEGGPLYRAGVRNDGDAQGYYVSA